MPSVLVLLGFYIRHALVVPSLDVARILTPHQQARHAKYSFLAPEFLLTATLQMAARRRRHQPGEEEWLRFKAEIYRLYLVEDRTLRELQSELERRGLIVS